MIDLIILQTVAPDYRHKLFEYLRNKQHTHIPFLYAGKTYFERTVKTDFDAQGLKLIKNYFFLNRSLLFQTGMWCDVINCKVLIIEMNPRIISNWLILLLRKIFNRKSILWGHAWPRTGKDSKSDKLRNLMRNLGDYIIVYTESQKLELQGVMPNKHIFVAPNATFLREEMVVYDNFAQAQNIIYVGRLSNAKKTTLLVKGFLKSLPDLPAQTKLIIVGDGEQKDKIVSYVDEHKIKDRVEILGHISNYHTLRGLYNNSLVSVSPGYIGLSVTQSFSFGVPMIVSKDENHSPEIEAVDEGFNALYFETDNVDSLKENILKVFSERQQWLDKRQEISNNCKKNYSIDSMGETILNLYSKVIIHDLKEDITKINFNINYKR